MPPVVPELRVDVVPIQTDVVPEIPGTTGIGFTVTIVVVKVVHPKPLVTE
jgi:hypothetical protein